jgi:Na+-transporting NADH:ubiquinone oxidoreductase subunit F
VELITFVGVSVAVFTSVILALVSVLAVAKSQLVEDGEVTVLINDDPDRSPKVQPGQTLLSALAAQKIFIPSACGGGGTCAMCKCQVLEGGGDVLPTEVGQLSLRERKDNVRLACQLKVKQDMKIRIPDDVFGVKKFESTVVSNHNVATFIKEFVVRLPDGMNLDFEPGGYIQIDVPKYLTPFREFDIEEEYHEDWDSYDVWQYTGINEEEGVYRAYSMANHPAEGNIVMLNIRIATPPRGLNVPPGVCSAFIFGRKPGDKVTISGPYGEFHINDTDREMIYVGGGAGMAPLRSHIFHLFHTLKTRDRKVSYWYGARSLREMFYEEDFRAIEREFDNFTFHIALSNPKEEDNWTGHVGFIHNVVIENYLNHHDEPEDCEFYFCGPPLMLKAVQKMCDDFGVPEENVRFDDFG